MRKLIIVVMSLLVVVLFIFQGFQQSYPLPQPEANMLGSSSGQSINDALNDIYYDVSIMGIQEATEESLAKDFGLDSSIFSEVYGRYTDGRFGIADVYIVRAAAGQEAAAREALITIRTARTSLFKNYNIYGASSLAEGGTIYSRGEYLILLMIDQSENVRATLNDYIPA